MLVRDYLNSSGLTKEQLADTLGLKTTSSVTKKMDAEMPKRWERLLDSLDDSPLTAVGGDSPESESEARSQNDDWERTGRDSDSAPNKPTDGETVVGPQRIKLATVEGYIQQIYGGAAYIATQRGDELAADVITRYSPEFSEAWVDYIKSDPRILEYLEKLMIGTPLGNLIGVHVIATGSYVFARVAARQVAAAYAADLNGNGAGDETAADSVGYP